MSGLSHGHFTDSTIPLVSDRSSTSFWETREQSAYRILQKEYMGQACKWPTSLLPTFHQPQSIHRTTPKHQVGCASRSLRKWISWTYWMNVLDLSVWTFQYFPLQDPVIDRGFSLGLRYRIYILASILGWKKKRITYFSLTWHFFSFPLFLLTQYFFIYPIFHQKKAMEFCFY